MNILALLASVSALCLLVCCAAQIDGGGSSSGDDASASLLGAPGDDATSFDEAEAASLAAWDSGTSSWGTPDAAAPLDAALLDAPDARIDAPCFAPLGPGVLIIEELMIESVAGTGDYGEWLEVRSTVACAVSLRGLHGSCPVGTKVHTFDVLDDLWVPPGGTFVVADSSDPAVNHDLPGPLLTWTGSPGDVLRNKGGTVTLTAAGAIVDSVTWPALKLVVGASVAFPAGCALERRSDWTAWQTSTASWFPAFLGTPNAPNDDVSCP
jgi:hypothetical protein